MNSAQPPLMRGYVRLQTKGSKSHKSSIVWTEESEDLSDSHESHLNDSDRELKEKFKILADIDEVNSSGSE